jgi:carboxypeptidase PM20D1
MQSQAHPTRARANFRHGTAFDELYMQASRPARPKTVARSALAFLALLTMLVAVLAVRTATFRHAGPGSPLQAPELKIDMPCAAKRLAEAVRFRTVGAETQPDSSPPALDELRNWLATSYPAFHAIAERTVVGGGTLLFEWQGSNASLPPIVLMAHQDVVPEVAPERWRHPPFSGALADDSVWGRGSIDNKGSLIAIMEAVEALAAAGHVPARTLLLVFGHDEETSGSGARAAAELLASRAVQAEFVLDEGSLVISDHPVTHGPVALIGISEKGYATVRVTARGEGGHASMPPRETAVATLARAIDAIMASPFPLRYDGATRAMLEALAPETPALTRLAIANAWLFRPILVKQIGATPQGAAMLHTTLAPTMLAGANRENVLPAEASATFNLRIAPGDTVANVMRHLRQSVAALPVTLELVGESRDPSMVSPTDGLGFRLISGAARAVFGTAVAPAPVIAATDSRHMAGLTRNIYRFQPLQLSLADTGMIHGIDEHLGTDALQRMVRFYAVLLTAGLAAQTAP